MRRFDVKPTERTSPRERPWGHWAVPRSVRRLVARVIFALLICAIASFYAAIAIQHANPPVIAVQAGSTGSPLSNGDLALLQGVVPSSLRTGSVIAVAVPPDLQTRDHLPPDVERRVVQVLHTPHGLRVATEAGGVSGRKPFEVLPSQILGEVIGSIPLVGYVFLFFGSLPGDVVLALLAGVGTTYFLTRRRTGRRPSFGSAVALGELMAQVQETGNQSRASAATLQELVGAVREYGAHLRSHTAVLRHLATTTEQLQVAATRLADTVAAGHTTKLTQPSPEQRAHASGTPETAGQPEAVPPSAVPPSAVPPSAVPPSAEVHGQLHGQHGQGTRRLVIDAEAWREPFTASELRHPNLSRTANRYVADTVDRLLDRAADALDLAERERNSLRDRLSVVEARLALLAARRERDMWARTGQDEEAVRFTHAPPFPGPSAPPDAGAPPDPGGSPSAPTRPGPSHIPPVWEVNPLPTR